MRSATRSPLGRLGAWALSSAFFFQPASAAAGPVFPESFSATLNSETYHQVVTGDRSRSFLTNGDFQKTNLDLFYSKTLEKGQTMDSQLNLQYLDDPLLIGHGSRFKALGGFFSAGKPQHYKLEAGYISPKATRATLTSTVLGLGGYYQLNAPGRVTRLSLVGGQIRPPVEGTQFQRGVAGGFFIQAFSGDQGSAKLLAGAYRVEDLAASIKHSRGINRLSLYLYTVGSELRSRAGLGLDWELAFLQTDPGSATYLFGRSLRISPSFKSEFLSASANFERNSPRFVNPVGSAAADAKKIDGSITIGTVNQFSLSSLLTRNNVEGQLSGTTKTQVTRASAKFVPFREHELWKAFSVGSDFSVSRSTGPSASNENRLVGLGLHFNEQAVQAMLRGEYTPLRDFTNPANDRDTYRATWQMGFKLRVGKRLDFDPSWLVSIERSHNRATDLWDQGGSAGGGFNAVYSGWLTVGFRHDFSQRVVKPSGRKIRNNSSQANVKASLKTKAPVELGFSWYRKHYYDTALNAFGEEEVRGTINVKF